MQQLPKYGWTMRKITLSLLVPALCCAAGGAVQSAQAQQVEIRGFETARDLIVTGPDDASGGPNSARSLTFSALGRQFNVALEPNARVNAAVRRAATRGVVAYRGALANIPGSWARIVIAEDGPSGLIWDGQTFYGIESPHDTATGSSETTVFRADDIFIPPDTMSCGINDVPLSGVQLLQAVVEEATTALATGAVLNLDMGAVADFEFTQLHPDPVAAILTRLNTVDGIYSEQLNVQITVQQIDVFDVAVDDPFTDATVPSDLLSELATYRAATPAQNSSGLTHLFTGRNLDGTTVGIAYLGALCRSSFGAGLTESSAARGALVESIVAAHEIGHNFGSPHDGEDACASTPSTGFIMASSLSFSNPPDQFSQCSLTQMQAEVASARCLSPIDFADIGLSASAAPQDLLTETQFQYVVTATNLGGASATNATVALEFAAGLEVLSVTPTSGSCGAAQSAVTCALGTLPGSSSRSITATLRAAAPGSFTISATASADENTVRTNDTLSEGVTVIAAVDLSLSAASRVLIQNQPANVQATLDNLAGLPASGVALTATASTGLALGAATLGGQPCVITGNTAVCELTTLAALGHATLNAELTGQTLGDATLSLVVDSTDRDRNADNNSASAAFTVTEASASQQDSGGGGGGLGFISLGALAAAWYRRRRRR
jgi:hypothetical protein